jgi:hypothetical protein
MQEPRRRRRPVAHRQLRPGADEGADGGGDDRPGPPLDVEVQGVVDGPRSGADRGDRERGQGEDGAVLPSLPGPADEEPVLAVAHDDGDEHEGDDARRRERREQPGRHAETGDDLRAGGQDGVRAARPHAHALEPAGRAGDAAATEELVRAVRDQGQTDGQPQHEQPEVDVVHRVRMARRFG